MTTCFCKTCNEVLTEDNWAPNRRKKGYNLCNHCYSAYLRAWRAKNSKEDTPRRKMYRDKWKWTKYQDNKDKAIQRLGGRCNMCGLYDRELSVFEFHHIDHTTKDPKNNIVILLRQNWGDRIETELDKCVVLCANCHRKVHARDKYDAHKKRGSKGRKR